MKRNKIKRKYLNNVKEAIVLEEEIKQRNKIIGNILKSVGLIFLLMIWNSIPIPFMNLMGIAYEEWSQIAKVFYLLGTEITFIIFLMFIYRKDLKKNFKSYFNRNFLANVGLSLKYWLMGLIVMFISNILIIILTNGATSTNEDLIKELIESTPLWYMAFNLIIYAPLSEELIFRKSFRNITNNKKVYILLSGIVFGGMHIISSLNTPYGILFLIPYSALGIAFAALYYKSDNIFSSIFAHALHNALSFILTIGSLMLL